MKENRNYKWIVLGLLFVAHFVVQGVCQLYYASIPPIRKRGDRNAGNAGTDPAEPLILLA